MKITKGEIEYSRFVIPYRIYGDSSEKIVCLCGAQQTMAIWRSFVSRFSKDFSIIIYDPPGHGQAKTLYGPPSISINDQIEVVREIVLMTHEGKKVMLAGASWGTIVGAGFASQYPQMVKKLLLGSFGGRPSKKMLKLIEEGQILVNENKGQQIGHLIIENFGQFIPNIYKKRIIKQFKEMPEEQFWSFYSNAELIKNILNINKIIDLNKITAKTLIVNGELDTFIDLEDIEIASSRLPDCDVKIVPNTGHFLHHENKEILEIYFDFFSE